MSDEKIIDKIKKCLRLSKSTNPHEAEAALRQARKLMETHGVSDLDIQAAEAAEERTRSNSARPTYWEVRLAQKTADAFGCRLLLHGRSYFNSAEWGFIGCGSAPEIATYAFTVLLRQVKRARAEHIKTTLKRCKPSTKTRRADLFCEAWVTAVSGTLAAFAGSEQQTAAIDAYMAKHYPEITSLTPLDRNDGRKLRGREYDDIDAGHRSGRSATLNRGVGGNESHAALEAKS